jgi:hypothetical protein
MPREGRLGHADEPAIARKSGWAKPHPLADHFFCPQAGHFF